jgi:hypothetical protein
VDLKHFWDIISVASRADPDPDSEEWSRTLYAQLLRLPPEEIVSFGSTFDSLAARADTADLVGACILINDGAGDDGFYYFRCWLVGMGKKVYEAAIANADSLADAVRPDLFAEAEIYGLARHAWEEVTGRDYQEYNALEREVALPYGAIESTEEWDTDSGEETRRRLPRLWHLFV